MSLGDDLDVSNATCDVNEWRLLLDENAELRKRVTDLEAEKHETGRLFLSITSQIHKINARRVAAEAAEEVACDQRDDMERRMQAYEARLQATVEALRGIQNYQHDWSTVTHEGAEDYIVMLSHCVSAVKAALSICTPDVPPPTKPTEPGR